MEYNCNAWREMDVYYTQKSTCGIFILVKGIYHVFYVLLLGWRYSSHSRGIECNSRDKVLTVQYHAVLALFGSQLTSRILNSETCGLCLEEQRLACKNCFFFVIFFPPQCMLMSSLDNLFPWEVLYMNRVSIFYQVKTA